MKAIQLELDFRSAITHALAEPEGADLRMLWRSLEPELLGLTEKEQLSNELISFSFIKLRPVSFLSMKKELSEVIGKLLFL
jgi:hypothetical protein